MLSTRSKIRIARALSRVARAIRFGDRNASDVVARRAGLNWLLDLNEGIDLSIYVLGAFERSTVSAYRRMIHPGDVVLDIGANIGAHTLHFAQLVGPTGMVIAYEPTQYAINKLRRNLSLNPDLAARVSAVQVMLTDCGGGVPEESIYSSWPLRINSTVHPAHRGALKSTAGAIATSLDEHLRAVGVSMVNFIKMDVDGFECHVLAGAEQSLWRFRPRILMELMPHLYPERGKRIHDLLWIFESVGYKMYSLKGQALSMDPETISGAIRPGSSINVLAMADSDRLRPN